MAEALDQDLKRLFFDGMSQAACTVNVVTTDGAAGRAGVTVSAMASVSADTPKPSLLVCVHRKSPAATAILDNEVFCVNVLRDDQSYISDTFAGRFKEQLEDKFDCADWTTHVTGAPRVVDPLVAFDCRLTASHEVGTHHIFLGQVEEIFVADRGSPLIYANRAYGSTMRIDRTASITAGQEASGRSLSIACLHTFAPYFLPGLITDLKKQQSNLKLELIEGDQRYLQASLMAGEADVALLYDMALPDEIETEGLTQLHTYVLLAEGHPLAEKASLTPADLAGDPMILLDAPPSRDYFLSIMRDAGIEPTLAYRSTSFELVRSLVGHGLGYALLGTKPASSMTYDGLALITRPLAADSEPSRIVLATRKNAQMSEAAKAFAELCRLRFGLGH